ncbi:MAG: antitoxin Xre/MbcA/ParS toxin-binding domain-containing protein [Cyclobacteriaceae bacterium]
MASSFNSDAFHMDDLSLVAQAQDGLDAQTITTFREHAQFSKEVMAGLLHITPKTIDNMKAKHKKIGVVQAEILLSLIRLFSRGEQLFGSIDEFKDWLGFPQPALEMQPPNKFLFSVTGIRLVEECLERIEQGYAA